MLRRRAKKKSRRKQGHRRRFTRLLVDSIEVHGQQRQVPNKLRGQLSQQAVYNGAVQARSIAQLGSVPSWGDGGRGFESRCSEGH